MGPSLCSPGETEPRGKRVDRPGCGELGAGPQTVAPPPSRQLDWGLSAALAGPVEKAVVRRREGKFRGRIQDAGAATGQWLAHGCLWTRAGTRGLVSTSSKCNIPSLPVPRAFFQPAVFQGGKEQGARCSWSGGRNCCLHSQGKHFQQRPPACIAAGSPNGRSSRSLGARWLL